MSAGEASGSGPGPGWDPGELLSGLAAIRRRTRAARRAYWFPLVLFGVLGCAAAPLYVAAGLQRSPGAHQAASPLLLLGGMPGLGQGFWLGWYWAIGLAGGYLLTVLWYRRHARRAGVRTPARGYLITGITATVLVIVLPLVTLAVPAVAVAWLPLADAWMRGTLAFLIIAAGLWVLARAERSRALAVIAFAYTSTAVLASLYNIENILFRLGWDPGTSRFGWRLTVLPDVLLPALVLLLSGLGAFAGQRWRARA